MKQFILPEMPDREGRVILSGKDYRYLVRVRRLAPGGRFRALLPSGDAAMVLVESTENGILTGRCGAAGDEQSSAPAVSRSDPGPEPVLPPILLFQGLPKGSKMDLIVRQAAEGGLSGVIPFVSDYSVPRFRSSAEEQAKQERWQRIVKEALQQSGSPIPTEVHNPTDVDGLLGYWEKLKAAHTPACGILLHQEPLETGTLHGYLSNYPGLVAFAVGPEGGFSPAELSRFLSAGFKPLAIGGTVLRTETAALYAAAAIRILLMESPWWTTTIPPSPNA